jgi:membrane-associated phospholipid phosphatase
MHTSRPGHLALGHLAAAATGALIAALAACSDSATAPAPAGPAPAADATQAWEASAALAWNAVARDQTKLTHPGVAVGQQFGARAFAYLSLAQYDAAVAAELAKDRGDHASTAAAVAGASAVVLSYFYPDQAPAFDARVQAQRASDQWPGETQTDFAAGEVVGRAVGQAVVTSAQSDGFTPSVDGVRIPVGPGFWVSAPGKVPVFPLLRQMRPFFLTSSDQFRPGPPPAFGSPAFLAALHVVRNTSDTRTAEQTAIAQFWAAPNGFAAVAQAYNNEVAADEIIKFHLDELRATRVLALANLAAMDAFIACHDAKYTYWLLRPPQADPGITLVIPLPNHPSYPSNHACVTGASMEVLAHFFPADAGVLRGKAAEAAISRIYGGIHYPFDADTGLKIGREAAVQALRHEPSGHTPLPIQ